MRTRLAVGCLAVLILVLTLFGQTANNQRTSTSGNNAVDSPEAERALIARYCLGCHSQAAKKTGLESALRITLDDLDPAHVEKNPERWETVVRKIRAGMMPPSGMPRPDAATYESMTAWLETELDRHAVTHVPPPGLQRMNRERSPSARAAGGNYRRSLVMCTESFSFSWQMNSIS